MRRVAIYGKGGIGKSTTASNITAALSEMGMKVMQIGCDPKADSTKFLLKGEKVPTILETIRNGKPVEDSISTGYKGSICVECGGPKPGTGCAGRGIIAAFEELERRNIIERYDPDVILYDVLGDVVCGGFAMPIRNGYARDVFIVTSGEMMSLYAANNIAEAISNMGFDGYAALRGIIQNSRNIADEDALIDKATAEMKSEVIFRIPRDQTVQSCENSGMTVVEGAPRSDLSTKYRDLAKRMLELSDDFEGGMRIE
jgi:Nitrogenase subunit NifH (ATPase)